MELKNQIIEAIRSGLEAPGRFAEVRYGGAGRAYVCLYSGADRKTIAAFKAAIQALGMRYLKEAYGSGKHVLYVGYDNFTGQQINQSIAIAKNLNEIGIKAYDDAVAD